MRLSQVLYRAASFALHRLTAWNTRGEGVHSPYLFYIVRMLLYDTNSYYAWKSIEQQRNAMLHTSKLVHTNDYGTGCSGEKKVQDIARTSLCSMREGQIYFRLVNFLSQQYNNKHSNEPLTILELGTSLGISTAYLAMPDARNQVITMDGSHDIIEVAKQNWQQLGIENVTCVEANIDDSLADTLINIAHAHVSLALIDANHTREATLHYFDQIAKYVRDDSIVIVDDIHHSREMNEAWQQIKHRDDVTATMDLYECGVIFFDHHYLKKHYKLRL